jgi:hypothetical protein
MTEKTKREIEQRGEVVRGRRHTTDLPYDDRDFFFSSYSPLPRLVPPPPDQEHTQQNQRCNSTCRRIAQPIRCFDIRKHRTRSTLRVSLCIALLIGLGLARWFCFFGLFKCAGFDGTMCFLVVVGLRFRFCGFTRTLRFCRYDFRFKGGVEFKRTLRFRFHFRFKGRVDFKRTLRLYFDFRFQGGVEFKMT